MRCRRAAVAVAFCVGCAWIAADAQAPIRGGDIFDSACAHCHGNNGQGGPLAPSIVPRVEQTDDAELEAFLRVGAPDRGMPPAPVTGEQMEALVDYLRFLGSAADRAASPEADALRDAAPGIASFRPVTEAVLKDPDDADWLPAARVREGRPFSPLDQVNAANVPRLALAWARGLPAGPIAALPIVYAGVMFVAMPDASVAALDAATGDVLWQHRRVDDAAGAPQGSASLSLFGDALHVAPERGMPFALDARTGALRTEAAVPPVEAAPTGPEGGSSGEAVLATAGGLLFRGGDDRRYAAVDAEANEVVWHTFLGGPIRTGGISYAVDGRQYVAVVAGGRPATRASTANGSGSRAGDADSTAGAIYVFALPDVEPQVRLGSPSE